MYCVKCGVCLADSEKVCPLCGTVPYHPDIERGDTSTFPPFVKKEEKKVKRWLIMTVFTVLYLIAAAELIICDLVVSRELGWSLYSSGAMGMLYVVAFLPLWFKRPNPVVFVPISFVSAGLYLWVINILSGGNWYLSFAFPLTCMTGLIFTALSALLRYLKKGICFTLGGTLFTLSASVVLAELFASITFNGGDFFGWSLYPASAGLVGSLFLIALGISEPLRLWFSKKFFI